jgi:hypothetical protein
MFCPIALAVSVSASRKPKQLVVQRRVDHVGIGSARGQQPGSLPQWHLRDYPCAQQVGTAHETEPPFIAHLAGQVQDAREPAAVPGQKGRGEYAHVLDGVVVEGTEQSEEVIDVVDCHAVKEHQVLVWRPAAHVQAGRAISGRADPGQELERAEYVRLAHVGQGRHGRG